MGHHKKKKKHKSKHRKRSSSDSDSPAEPIKKQRIIGPSLHAFMPAIVSVPSTSTLEVPVEDDSYGPQLPPHLTQREEPPQFQPAEQSQENPGSDDEVIGPLPAGAEGSKLTQQALDERAEILKYQFLLKDNEDDTAPHRETWMTELPPEKANFFGLGARQFKKSTNTGDPKNRALWTVTPQDKNKPETVEENTDTFDELVVAQRNKIMDDIVEKTKEQQETKSLLEIHREKLKKKKQKNKSEKQDRRPFDRDVDLQVNRFDEAQKKSMLKKAQLLDSRFAHGKSKYL